MTKLNPAGNYNNSGKMSEIKATENFYDYSNPQRMRMRGGL